MSTATIASRCVVPPPVLPPSLVRVSHIAGRADATSVDAGMELLRGLGFAVERDARLPEPSLPYLAGPDWARRRDLLHALSAPHVAAVIAARGGYGAMRTLAGFPSGILEAHPKWVVGYSDITAVHLWAYREGVCALHGPMASGLAKHRLPGDPSIPALVDALAGRPRALSFARWSGPERAVRGPLVGGNLSMLAALRPSPRWPDLDGAILVIEDVNEAPYRIDRMATTLVASGLPGLAAIVVGQLTGPEPDAQLSALLDVFGRLRVPILIGAPVGHGVPNVTWVHGGDYAAQPGDASLAPVMIPPVRAHTAPSLVFPAPRARSGVNGGPEEIAELAVTSGVCSGVQLVVTLRGETLLDLAVGHEDWESAAPVTHETAFDLASVTKALCTAPLAHWAVERGLVGLADPCPAELCASRPSLRALLNHTSGLPAHREVFAEVRPLPAVAERRARAEEAFADILVEPSWIGRERYSDVGYVALGRWLEVLLRRPLDAAFRALITDPLGLSLAFTPGPDGAVASTEWCAWRGHVLRGVVHDENAQVLGGVCGHAGLFGSARDVAAVANALLDPGGPVLPPAAVARMWDHAGVHSEASFTLGWDTPAGPSSNAGRRLDPATTVGHLGFTGCSVWIEQRQGLVIALNTNRVHPHRDHAGIRWLRPALHDAVADRVLTTVHHD